MCVFVIQLADFKRYRKEQLLGMILLMNGQGSLTAMPRLWDKDFCPSRQQPGGAKIFAEAWFVSIFLECFCNKYCERTEGYCKIPWIHRGYELDPPSVCKFNGLCNHVTRIYMLPRLTLWVWSTWNRLSVSNCLTKLYRKYLKGRLLILQ